MRLVLTEQVSPPVCLARTIYDPEGKTILTKGTILNECYINRLKELGIQSIYVDDGKASVEIDGMVSEQVRLLVGRDIKEALLKLVAGESAEARTARRTISDIMNELMLNRELMVHLIDIFSLKDHSFHHSINVYVLSMLTGLAMGYEHPRLMELGTGALLHDVGKVTVLDNIVNSKGIFVTEEYQIIQRHAECGYKILEKAKTIDVSAAEVAWQHHERYNGTGYPEGLSGSDISEYARIVAIADVFDAVSTDRPYREALLPHEVIQIIKDGEGSEFEPEIARKFISSLIPYPLGSHVVLNNASEGIVISIDKSFPARPRVQLLGEKGNRMCSIHIVDLMAEQDKFIVRVVRN